MKQANSILYYPLTTEKAVRVMERENKLLFRVALTATRNEVKAAVASLFGVQAIKVTTLVTSAGQKRAYVKLPKDHPAMDVITKLGLM
ncbi:50S ribosomal protein L23 [Candidatus Woesearchaeota archaeon]|nr:50S ribosomal protein L23 [Candidatus Woesearchaeota archaeon]